MTVLLFALIYSGGFGPSYRDGRRRGKTVIGAALDAFYWPVTLGRAVSAWAHERAGR